MPRWLKPTLIALLAVTVTSVFFIDFCNLVYQCGCKSLWAGAAGQCNIHNHSGKHCPWCSFGQTGYAIVYGSMIVPQILLAFLPRRRSLPARLIWSLLAFPVAGAGLAVVFGLITGYWS